MASNSTNENPTPGFIGTGAIAEAVIIGLIEHAMFDGDVCVSQRSELRSRKLAARFPNVRVEEDNQKIVDRCNYIFLSVLPDQAREVLAGLRFTRGQTLISLVAGISVGELKSLAAPLNEVHRMIPLPPIEYGVGPLPICPPDRLLAELFNGCGKPIGIENEEHFSAFSAASAVMAAHHQMTATVARWIEDQGINRRDATAYASHMLHSLTTLEARASADQLMDLAEDCLTAGGLNEQVLNELEQSEWFGTLRERLDRIACRLRDQD